MVSSDFPKTNVPGPAPGPPSGREPAAGTHTALPARGLPGVIQAGAGAGPTWKCLRGLMLGIFISTLASKCLRALMLGIFISTLALVCSSCTVATGSRTAGTWTYASALGNAKFGEMGPEGMRNAEIDNATGGAIIERTAEKVASAWMWGQAAEAVGNLIDGGFDALKDSNDSDVKINAADNATKAQIKTFVPPPLPHVE